MSSRKPGKEKIVIITGAAGKIGSALTKALCGDYTVIGLDLHKAPECDDSCVMDLSARESVDAAMRDVAEHHGRDIHAVIHLAAYYDFTGRDSPLYKTINEEGTRKLLQALQDFNVGRFIYSGTMLVHAAVAPGRKITEDSPVNPSWAYPQSKARTEDVIKQEHGDIPYTILRLAGLYDNETAVPTLSHQVARIFENDIKSHLYPGDTSAGQAFIHRDDMISAFIRTVEKAADLPDENILLVGEPDTLSYEALQNRIASLIHGEERWHTHHIPEAVAKSGAWMETRAEKIIPDALDEGEEPFIRPFMVDLSSGHYELDTTRAEDMLGWRAEHRIYDALADMVGNLKSDPAGWYDKNGLYQPEWLESAVEKNTDPVRMRERYTQWFRKTHASFLWAHFCNIILAFWLVTSPAILGYESAAMRWSDGITGVALLVFACLSLSARLSWARWVCGALGLWLLMAPLVFWAPTAAAYLNDTLVGTLAIGFAVISRPVPGMSIAAAMTGPTIPPGWRFSPSSWFQRLPIIALALVGFFISRYLAAYQLGHIDGVWEPFFGGAADNPKNGTEEIITSSVSEAWPVPDAGLGAVTYMLELIVGLIGSARRWRTMPWLVMLFGFMIVPLGIISITFIVIQPIIIGTWCTLCLIAAAAMLVQIPYSLDELVATGQFLVRRHKAGRPWLKIFFTGDTDEGEWQDVKDDFAQKPGTVIADTLGGGVVFTWNLLGAVAIGIWLMFTRVTLGTAAGMADADHLIGAMVVTIAVTAFAETARPVRFLLIPFGFALLVTPFVYGVGMAQVAASVICGLALMGLSLPRGKVTNTYGGWDKYIH